MFKNRLICVIVLIAAAVTVPALAAGENSVPERNEAQQQEQVRGRDLMSPQERAHHREQMRSMKSEEERKAYREKQHQDMQERAKEKGVTLPADPRQDDMVGGRPGGGGPQR